MMPDEINDTIDPQTIQAEDIDDPSSMTPEQMDAFAKEQGDAEPAKEPEKPVGEEEESGEEGKTDKGEEAKKDEKPDYSEVLKGLDKVEASDEAKAKFTKDPETAAMSALIRDYGGKQAKMLQDWLARDPVGFVEAGLHRFKSQNDVDRMLSDRKESADPDKQEKADTPKVDLTQAVDSFAEMLGLDTEDGKEAIKGFAEAIGNAYSQQYAGQFGDMTGQVQAMGQKLDSLLRDMTEAEVVGTRTELMEADDGFPELKDDAVYAEVRSVADTLFETGKFGTMSEAFESAASMKLGRAQKERVRNELLNDQRQRRDSTPRKRPAGGNRRHSDTEQEGIAVVERELIAEGKLD